MASGSGNLDKVDFLLKCGCSRKTSASGYTPLIPAINHGCSVGLIILLLSGGFDINANSEHGESALKNAVGRGRFDIVKLLLLNQVDPNSLKWDELMWSIAVDSCELAVDAIQRYQGDLYESDLGKRTPMLLAAIRGEVDMMSALVGRGVKVADQIGHCGYFALMFASVMNHVQVALWCIEQSVDPNQLNDFGETALMKASCYGAEECVRLLLDHGADAHVENQTQCSAITEANNMEVVKLLMDAGCDINKIDGSGYNLLKGAAERDDDQFIAALLAAGADPNVTSTGESPLHKAGYNDNLVIMKELLRCGADPNQEDADGWTPLFTVQSIAAIELLLAHGADPRCQDQGCMSSAEWIAKRNPGAAEYLRKRMRGT